MDFALKPGDRIPRVELHRQYGGRQQGGIGPSLRSPNVFLFSDPTSGHPHGYFDGWGDDGCYHFAGEGQSGDQAMIQGNLAIKNHDQAGRALRLFDGARGTITYVGEFRLATESPWYLDDAPATGTDEVRSVIMFRLVPIDATDVGTGPRLPQTPRQQSMIRDVEVEQAHTERSYVNPSRQQYTSERREAKLVDAYKRHLVGHGHAVSRKQILPAGDLKPLFTDLYDATAHTLIEAKGTVTREAVRMAIGQLADYRRFIEALDQPLGLAVLLPSQPRKDLLGLCHSNEIAVIWPEHGRVRAAEPPTAPGAPGGRTRRYPRRCAAWTRRKRRATYHRYGGIRHLFAALDLHRDKLYGHIKPTKRRTQFLEFCRYLRSLYLPEVRLAVVGNAHARSH